MELDYTVCIDDLDKNIINIQCDISHIEQNELTLQFGEKGHKLEGIDDRVVYYEAMNEDGKPLAVERIDLDTWRIAGVNSSKILWKYILRLPDHYCTYDTSFLTDTYAYFYIPQIFMVSDPIINGCAYVTFKLPQNWKIYTLWTLEQGRYCPGRFHRLCRGYMALGHYQYHETVVDKAKLKIAISNELACHPEPLSMTVEKILKHQAEIFNEQVKDDLLIICQNAGRRSWGGSPSSNVVAIAVPEDCTDDTLTRDPYIHGSLMNPLRLIIHELFHTWSIGHFSTPRKIDYWWSEGITSYYTLLTSTRLQLMDETDAYQLLYDLYAKLTENPYVGSLNALEAGIKFHEVSEEARQMDVLCVGKGMLFAFFLDVEIRYTTHNDAGLDELIRRIHKHPELGTHKRGWSYDDLCEILGEFTSIDLMSYITRYIEGTELIPFLDVIGRIGLNIQETNGEKKVSKQNNSCLFANLTRKSIFLNAFGEVK